VGRRGKHKPRDARPRVESWGAGRDVRRGASLGTRGADGSRDVRHGVKGDERRSASRRTRGESIPPTDESSSKCVRG
jgi:hypothetical protein